MASITLSSREFNQDVGRAKRAASQGPVFITDRKRPAHVLLTIEDYQRLAGNGLNIVDLLGSVAAGGAEFEPPRVGDTLARPADFN